VHLLRVNNKVLVICSGSLFAILVLVGVSSYLRRTASALLPDPPTHGLSLVIQVDLPESPSSTNDLASLREALRRRADALGFRIYWEPLGPTRARVLARILNPEAAEWRQQALCRGGNLEFRLVHANSKELLQSGSIPAGYRVLQHELPQALGPNGAKTIEKLVVKIAPEEGLSGPLVRDASVTKNNLGQPEIMFRLKPETTPAFARVTRENLQRRLAIIVDGRVLSAPVIISPIETGEAVIAGQFSNREAFEQAAALESPLPVPIAVLEAKQF